MELKFSGGVVGLFLCLGIVFVVALRHFPFPSPSFKRGNVYEGNLYA